MVKGEIDPRWGGKRKAKKLGWIGMCCSKTEKGEKRSQGNGLLEVRPG